MGKECRNGGWWLVAILSLAGLAGCGGSKSGGGTGSSIARIFLTPSVTTSVQLGSAFAFTAVAQNAANQAIGTTITFTSSDTSILNVSPTGLACAGHWDAFFTTCTPGAIGQVTVTASAGGISSVPTYVFVHAPIDNVTVTGVLLNNVPIQEPCLSQGQSMTVEAHAFSQGSDITTSVGPFTWSANNATVVRLTPIVNTAYNFPTNQATALAVNPGVTQVIASVNGASSTSFQQPQFANSQGTLSPVFDFFETCPIQNILLELNNVGSRQNTFATSKGAAQTAFATVTDVMGNSSLPNTDGGIVLTKIPLTWTSTQPAAIAPASGCQLSCSLTTPAPGAAGITASCSPPTCNIEFQQPPPVLSSAACTQFVQALFPNVDSCQQFIPLPVYASPLPGKTTAAISGFVGTGGTPATSTTVATSMGCSTVPPLDCSTSVYGVSTSGGSPGGQVPMPVPPNSMLFDLGGDRAFVGSDFGVQLLNPSGLSSNSGQTFIPEGSVTGKVLAVSSNGVVAVFSDTVHTPNQVYLLNTGNPSAPATALNINGATAAAFSPDGLKAFIFGFDPGTGNPNLYILSPLQALQTIPLPAGTTVSSIVFSTNGAFAYVVEPSLGGGGPAFTVFNTCNNSVAQNTSSVNQTIPLSAPPIAFKALPDGIHFLALEGSGTFDYFAASITGIPPATQNNPANSLCPMMVNHQALPQISFGQANIHPFDFFVSPDETLLYLVASDLNSVLIYDFATASPAGGIQLASTPFTPNPTPVTAGITADGSFIMVAGSDSYLHRLSTAVGGVDQQQIQFPSLPNVINPFCTARPCNLDLVAVRP